MAASDEQLPAELLTSSTMQELEMALSSGQLDPDLFDPDLLNTLDLSAIQVDTNAQTPGGLSADNFPEKLEVIAEPFYGKKLRYRKDYDKYKNRLGSMKNRTKNSSYQGPAIRIPRSFLNAEEQNYVRVSLVTVRHSTNNCQYIHPYELENATNTQFNDRTNNVVWFPIQGEDLSTGIKSFSSLRIVKRLAPELLNHVPLKVFDHYDQNLSTHPTFDASSSKAIIQAYRLDHSQLAFTIAKLRNIDGRDTWCIHNDTTVFSQEMIEGAGEETDADNDGQSSTDSPPTRTPSCRVATYAPKYGFAQSQEEMIIIMTQKVEERKYGELKVTFQCTTAQDEWSVEAIDLTVKDRIVSLKTPSFPCLTDETTAVEIVLSQNGQHLQQLSYFYLETLTECSNCQRNKVTGSTRVIPNTPNKRSTSVMFADDEEGDGVVPASEPVSELRQSVSQSEASVTTDGSRFASLPPMHIAQSTDTLSEEIMQRLTTAMVSLFVDNDNKPLLRMSRPLLKKEPQTLHRALDNGHLSLMIDFIPLAALEILQAQNERDETLLLHAVRLNRIGVVQALLDTKHASVIAKDVDYEQNNIFHILASNPNTSELLDLVIRSLLEKNISIKDTFDQPNESHRTPLQMSICQNNLPATQRLFKHSKTKIYQTRNNTGDNFVHLSVRHADLEMIKYLIDENDLLQQGNESNLTMTPMELARSLQRADLVEYFDQKYPRHDSDDESSDDDDSE